MRTFFIDCLVRLAVRGHVAPLRGVVAALSAIEPKRSIANARRMP